MTVVEKQYHEGPLQLVTIIKTKLFNAPNQITIGKKTHFGLSVGIGPKNITLYGKMQNVSKEGKSGGGWGRGTLTH